MSPILVRPVREQLEHDRVIRLLQAKYKRKFDVAINPGNEQSAPVGSEASPWYPDLVLHSTDKARKLAGVVEVESAESVNHLEAMSQWKAFAGLRVPFHLYLPTTSIDTARRFCADMDIPVAEIWAYQSIGDQIRFALVQRAPGADERPAEKVAAEPAEAAAARPKAAPRQTPSRAAAAPPRAAARTTRTAAGSARTNSGAPRPRTNGPAVTRRPATTRRAPAAPARAAAKPKPAPARRAAAKPAAGRKAKTTAATRAHKRR